MLWAAMAAACVAQAAAHGPQVWMNHVRVEPLAREGARWGAVQRGLDVLELPVNAVAFITPHDDLRRLGAVCKRNRIRIAVECGYFDWQSASPDFGAPNPKRITDTIRTEVRAGVGELTAAIEVAKLQNLVRAGATPDMLNLDGPVRRMLWPGSDVGRGDIAGLATVDDCVRELIAYMRAMRRAFPRLRFYALTNFPNWGWKGEPSYWGGMFYGDYYEVVQKIIDGTRKARIPIDGVTADHPYEYASGRSPHKGWMPLPRQAQPTHDVALDRIDWMGRLLELERLVKGRGMRFNLIVNSQGGGESGSEAFCRGTLSYLDAYLAAGGRADGLIVQSWYKYPDRLEPEDEPWTMTNLVRSVLERLQRPTAR